MTEITVLPAINQSQITTWLACQRKWGYRYDQKLIPRWLERAPHIGTWGHACLQGLYADGDWRVRHEQFVEQYNKLFEEERQKLDKGNEPLPSQIERIMQSYRWYYRREGWEVVAVEQEFELDSGLGFRWKGRIDLIVRDPDGLLWVVDHKFTMSYIPPETAFHAMHPQLVLYPWAAEQVWGMNIAGVIFNYVRAKAPTVPMVNKDGSMSKRAVDTDYPTLYRFLKERDENINDFTEILRPLFVESPFLKRYKLHRDPVMTERILSELRITAGVILDHPNGVVRNVTRDCERCAYNRLCRGELQGLDMAWLRDKDYQIEAEGTPVVEGIESEGDYEYISQ